MPIYNKMHLLPTPTYLKYIARQLYSGICDHRFGRHGRHNVNKLKSSDINVFILNKLSDPPIQIYICPHYTLFSK